MTRRAAPRGSVLVEGAAALGALAVAVLLSVELARRSQLEMALHHGAFLAARHRALGLGEGRSRRLVARWLREALGEARAAGLLRSLTVERIALARGPLVRLHTRFPQLLAFSVGGRRKHHFEVTKSCRFPFSRR